MGIHITIPAELLDELRNAEHECEVLKSALLQAQNAAIELTHQDIQRRAEYEDLQQTMRDMARNHALQLEAARKHEPESVPELRAQLQTLEADAKRYRFLRNDFSVMGANIDGQHSWAYRRNFSLRGPTLDAAIDTAMGAAPALGAA